LLHMDVFLQRLKQEYGIEVITTAPSVPYKVVCRNGEVLMLSNPSDFPDEDKIEHIEEPLVNAAIVCPSEYMGTIYSLCADRRGIQKDTTHMGERVRIAVTLPLAEVVTDFYDHLKRETSGYASFEYDESEYVTSDVVKMNILLNGEAVDALSVIVHKEKAYAMGRALLLKLANVVSRQLFQITLQAAVGSKVICRESLSAMRKDVLAKCYGGDITRKRKLLDKQKEGKKKMKRIGNVDLPQEAFVEVLKRNSN